MTFSRYHRSCRKRPSSMSLDRSRLVAAMTRTLTGSGRPPPTGVTADTDNTRSRAICCWTGISPISSRNSVPPSASTNRPGRPFTPVAMSGRMPNSSLSSSVEAIAPQFTATNGLSERVPA